MEIKMKYVRFHVLSMAFKNFKNNAQTFNFLTLWNQPRCHFVLKMCSCTALRVKLGPTITRAD